MNDGVVGREELLGFRPATQDAFKLKPVVGQEVRKRTSRRGMAERLRPGNIDGWRGIRGKQEGSARTGEAELPEQRRETVQICEQEAGTSSRFVMCETISLSVKPGVAFSFAHAGSLRKVFQA